MVHLLENPNNATYQVLPGDEEFLFVSISSQREIVVVDNWLDEGRERLAGS